ncbi:MAG: PepSY domain-containing protein [Bradyrhizobium sp.]|nr:PepSY domain-containing protein [Bradyrhizobium sp.]
MPMTPERGRLYGAFWRWHFLAALIVIPFVLWQSTTGTLYLWSEWWMDVSHPDLRFVPTADATVPPSAQIAAAFAAIGPTMAPSTPDPSHGGHDHHAEGSTSNVAQAVQQIVLSDDLHRSTEVILQGPDGLPYPIFVDPHTGDVLGRLNSGQWLPGITRALHAGWPLGRPGNWLLELGNCWAIMMIVTGLYLWWPRGRSISQSLLPRLKAGPRAMLRDLHATVAVIFSTVFLFFLVSALPWTAFWGGELLSRIQHVLNQESPAGFSAGGASSAQIMAAGTSIDAVVQAARQQGVTGTITVQMSPWHGAPLFVANRTSSLREDRIIHADPATGHIDRTFRNEDLPVIPRVVAVGIHIHQGDFGLWNVWLNTLLAISLIWLTATGLLSWWIRRPKGKLGLPPAREVPWSVGMTVPLCLMGLLLPIFGLSVLAVAAVEWGLKRPRRWRPA